MKKIKIIAPLVLFFIICVTVGVMVRYDLFNNPDNTIDISEALQLIENKSANQDIKKLVFSASDSLFNKPDYDDNKYDSYPLCQGQYSYIVPKSKEEIREDSMIFQILQDGSARLIGLENDMKKLSIPKKVKGHAVKYIGAVGDKTLLSEVIIPEEVIVIENNAFQNCTNLKKVEFSKKLLLIGDGAFLGCVNLCEISIKNSVSFIGNESFGNCVCLSKFVCPEELMIIGDGCFKNDTNLKSAQFNSQLSKIGSMCFESTGIESVVISQNIRSIGKDAFKNCESLKKAVFSSKINDSSEIIEFSCFQGCSSLESVILPKNITELSDNAFRGCGKLKEITLPESLNKIGHYTFFGCSKLKNVYFEGKDCTIEFDSFLLSLGLKFHAQAGGSIEDYCSKKLFISFAED